MADQPSPPPGRRPARRPGRRIAPPKSPRALPPVPTWEKPEKLVIGKVLRPHGLDGTVRVELYTEFPEHVAELRYVYIDGEERPRRLQRAQVQPRHALLKLVGVRTEEEAQAIGGRLVRIDFKQAAPLPPGAYYHWQIIGARVVDESGAPLGVVAEIIETGANDVYVVRTPADKELLLPAINEVIRQVDTEQGIITVHLLPGLVDE